MAVETHFPFKYKVEDGVLYPETGGQRQATEAEQIFYTALIKALEELEASRHISDQLAAKVGEVISQLEKRSHEINLNIRVQPIEERIDAIYEAILERLKNSDHARVRLNPSGVGV